jgi:hypothetical protein
LQSVGWVAIETNVDKELPQLNKHLEKGHFFLRLFPNYGFLTIHTCITPRLSTSIKDCFSKLISRVSEDALVSPLNNSLNDSVS